MEVGKHVTLSRNLRSISIMGKSQGKEVDMATLFYPPLQVADIFTLGANLAHAGMDQRKAHVIAKDVAKKLTINPLKNSQGEVISPIAIHHKLIAGLTGPEKDENDNESLKMSKSKPNSAIFIHDTPDEIRNKIRKAYGPPKEIEFNPLINWVETLVFWGEKTGEFKISRPERYGGDVVYTEIDKLIADYKSEKLYPMDLKNGLAEWLIEKLAPARKYFEKPEAKENLEKMREFLAKK
jgi:tyrosyl-tRNA synthetase